MRYFVFKDAQILGPFEREELDRAGGLRPETLICSEGVSGRRDADWRALAEVAELDGVATLDPHSLGLAEYPIEQSPLVERAELEALGVVTDDVEPEWLRGLFDDTEFKQRFGLGLKSEASDEALSQAQGRILDLTTQLTSLKSRLLELEGEQSRLLHRFLAGVPLETATPPAPAVASAPVAPPPPAPAPQTAIPVLPPAAPAPVAHTFPTAPPVVQAPAPLEPPPPPAAEGPAPRFALRRAPAASKLSLKFGPTKSFRKVGEPAPTPAPAPEPTPTALPSAPPPEAPAPVPAPALAAAPPPMFGLPPAPVAAPAPEPAPAQAEEAPSSLISLTPAPVPTFEPAPATIPPGGSPTPNPLQPPMTMRFQVTTSAMPAPGPLPFDATPAPMPSINTPAPMPTAGPATQELLARLAKPAPAPATQVPAPRPPSRKFAVIGAAAVTALAVLAFLFFHNNKDLKSMVAMGADQKPIGIDDGAAAPPQQQPGAVPFAPRPAALPAPTAAPAPAPAPALDENQQAIDLVKGYPLDGDRGTVSQWLQYSFLANPADGNKEEWTAGAIEGAYLVQYRMIPGQGSRIKDSISYVFEVDLQRQTVRGQNPPARQLMAGNGPALTPAKPKKAKPKSAKKPAAAKRRPAARKAAPLEAAPPVVPLAPLPSDAELLPPADNDSKFSKDTVNPAL